MRGICLLVAAIAMAPGPRVRADDAIVLKASAGLGGLSKPGRWIPVRVSLESARDVTGELVVRWGDAVAHRRVALAAPARQQLELYVRTSDPAERLTIELQEQDARLGSVDVPIRNLSPDEDVTLCVVSAAAPAKEEGCTGVATTDVLPSSFRGYDAIDRIDWRAGPKETLAPAVGAALADWQAYHDLDFAGLLSRVPRAASAASTKNRSSVLVVAALGIVLYVLAIAAGGAWARRPASHPLTMVALLGTFSLLTSTLTLSLGRAGPGSTVVVRPSSTLVQLGRGRSLVTLRGTVEYPAFDGFEIHVGLLDGDVEHAARRMETWLDESGRATIVGRHALGASEEIVVEGIVDFAPLSIERRSDGLRIRNASAAALVDCALSDGLSVEPIATLLPGQSAEARPSRTLETPFVSCQLTRSPVLFTEGRHSVEVEGGAIVSAYVPESDRLSTETPR